MRVFELLIFELIKLPFFERGDFIGLLLAQINEIILKNSSLMYLYFSM